jgi:tagatose-1,6-bisphosphate aldolase non-catalytic subunit AgaZ/GatZ
VIPLSQLVQRIISLRAEDAAKITLLAACPNSEAVLEASVKLAASNNVPMLFAATLNQVDRDGGYTGWTPKEFVDQIQRLARKYQFDGPLYPCLDHGGPWLKDAHTIACLNLDETMAEVKESLSACIEAGYQLLHIDPTVDRTLPPGQPVPIDVVIDRTLELLIHSENVRYRLGLPPISYEVGTEEVHGGLADVQSFEHFVQGLRQRLEAREMLDCWPCFIVGKVGTDLHTTFFDPETASRLFEIVSPYGSLVKGHYTDWVDNPCAYPESGMGGANVGPEFTAEEYQALIDLSAKEKMLGRTRTGMQPSDILHTLEQAVIRSRRWEKWLQPDEQGKPFSDLAPERQRWLVQTGARYVWSDREVVRARQQLYENLSTVMLDPHQYVVNRIARAIDKYVNAFNLFNATEILEGTALPPDKFSQL